MAKKTTVPGTPDPVDAHTYVTHPALIVRSSLPNRRRIGRLFGAAPVTIEVDSLTAAEVATLKADPCLIVARVE